MQNIKAGVWRSLSTRVTFFTLVIFVISIWSLAWYASRLLRDDMQRQLSEQQLSMVSLVATEINQGLEDRLRALDTIAATLDASTLLQPAQLQSRLEKLVILQELFNGGTTVLAVDGTAIADFPRSAGRLGVNDMDLEVVQAALQQGKTSLGKPILDKFKKTLMLAMAAPIRDAQGAVIGALSGAVNLAQPNFLTRITQGKYGKTGGYLLLAPQEHLVLTATDKRRALSPIEAGSSPLADRFLQGLEGSGLSVNQLGEAVLVSVKGVPLAGWTVAAVLPAPEAFGTINDLHQHMLLATLFMTFMAAVLTWWMLRRQLSPMLAAVKTLTALSNAQLPVQPLSIVRHDEIGELLAGVNRMLTAMGERQVALQASEKRFRDLFEKNSSVMFFMDPATGHITDANEAAATYLGYTRAQLVGMPINRINTQSQACLVQEHQQAIHARTTLFEFSFRLASGEIREVEVYATPMDDERTQMLAIVHDITERKQAQEMLQKLSVAVEQSPAAVVIADLSGTIQYVNPRFTQITGYSAAEAMGKNPRILRSMQTSMSTYEAMWQELTHGRAWHGELLNKRKNGELYWEEIQVAPVMNPAGVVTHYVAVKTDITERKHLEAQVRQLAFHDALTQLPNRHLLNDRLGQSMAASKRSGRYGALLFLDLDNFKPLNDAQGHDVGDLLLMEVADRLKKCVREVDTVARFGGDEFVVILSELCPDKADAIQQASLIADKIRAALAQPYVLSLLQEGKVSPLEHHCTASIGVALFVDPEVRLDDVIKWADKAMYQAKAVGRNQVRFYQTEAGAVA